MSTPLSQVIVAHGRLSARFFREDGRAGDWQSWAVPLPAIFPADGVRIVAMASSDGVDEGLGTIAAVPVITRATRTGFTLAARNSDCAAGSAGMHWFAVLERAGQASPTPVELRTCLLQARGFAPDCSPGDWNSWEYAFGRPMPTAPTVVGAPTRMRGDVALTSVVLGAFLSDAYLLEGMPAPVGVLSSGRGDGVSLSARNGGGWSGRSSMNFIALSDLPRNVPPDTAPVLDSGTTPAVSLSSTGGGVPVRIDVNFGLPFSAPPVVLITACDVGLPVGTTPVAAIGVAQGVTTHGFTLEAMNTDSASGRAAFHWVAIGCGISCGAGRAMTVPTTTPGGTPFTPPRTPPGTPLTPTRSTSDA
jgi:hypothetical protein